ncbi:hypothetical protein Q3G72_029649 [Acer saccharum]|nr:hypothetical protein Q3G72_029649 [Acer saccharum]
MSSLNHLLLLSNCFFFFLQFQQCFSINGPPLINRICLPSNFYDVCVQTLNAAPGAATADLTTLAAYSFKLTYDTVATTDGFLQALLQNVTDPGVKQVVTYCITSYDVSIPSVQSAITDLEAGASHFGDINNKLYPAWSNIHDCDRVVKIGPPPPAPGAATADFTTLAAFSLKPTYEVVAATDDAFLMALLPNVKDPSVKQSLLF